jgi:CRP/FNR family cyclic AMP-dependent transcriptional regulator
VSELLEKILFLQKVDMFEHLTVPELQKIAHITETDHYNDEEYLFRQGDPGNYAYIVISGEVEIFFESGKGDPRPLATVGEGTCFGEMALLDGEPRSAGARTVSECMLSRISRRDFIHIMHQYPAIALGIISQLSLRIREMNGKVTRLSKVVTGFADLYEQSRHALDGDT